MSLPVTVLQFLLAVGSSVRHGTSTAASGSSDINGTSGGSSAVLQAVAVVLAMSSASYASSCAGHGTSAAILLAWKFCSSIGCSTYAGSSFSHGNSASANRAMAEYNTVSMYMYIDQ